MTSYGCIIFAKQMKCMNITPFSSKLTQEVSGVWALVFLTSAPAPCCADRPSLGLTAFSDTFITFIHVYFGTLAARKKGE